jgi:hypothetical protein
MIEKSIQHDSLKGITGSVRKQLFDEKGILIYDHTDSNLVVTVGPVFLASWLTATTQSTKFMSWVGLGTGGTAPVIGNTDLEVPLVTRVQGILTTPGSTNIWQNVATFGPGVDTGAITEAGLFSTDWTSPTPAGTMFARNTFGALNKGSGNTFVLTWQITF